MHFCHYIKYIKKLYKKRYRDTDITGMKQHLHEKLNREVRPNLFLWGKQVLQSFHDKSLSHHDYFEKSVITQMIEGVPTELLRRKNI